VSDEGEPCTSSEQKDRLVHHVYGFRQLSPLFCRFTEFSRTSKKNLRLQIGTELATAGVMCVLMFGLFIAWAVDPAFRKTPNFGSCLVILLWLQVLAWTDAVVIAWAAVYNYEFSVLDDKETFLRPFHHLKMESTELQRRLLIQDWIVNFRLVQHGTVVTVLATTVIFLSLFCSAPSVLAFGFAFLNLVNTGISFSSLWVSIAYDRLDPLFQEKLAATKFHLMLLILPSIIQLSSAVLILLLLSGRK